MPSYVRFVSSQFEIPAQDAALPMSGGAAILSST